VGQFWRGGRVSFAAAGSIAPTARRSPPGESCRWGGTHPGNRCAPAHGKHGGDLLERCGQHADASGCARNTMCFAFSGDVNHGRLAACIEVRKVLCRHESGIQRPFVSGTRPAGGAGPRRDARRDAAKPFHDEPRHHAGLRRRDRPCVCRDRRRGHRRQAKRRESRRALRRRVSEDHRRLAVQEADVLGIEGRPVAGRSAENAAFRSPAAARRDERSCARP